MTTLTLIAALLLFWAGLRLSAFFSGSETGFYRVSFLRLSIEAQAGDRTAKTLCWFLRRPDWFVSTTLAGNNVANYLTTIAIGLVTMTLMQEHSGIVEVAATILVTPFVFVFGELMPKVLYLRAPRHQLMKGARWFEFFFWILLPVSAPLRFIARAVKRFGQSEHRDLELVLGRKRLVQVLSEGHREGLLTNIQNRLIDGLLDVAGSPANESMTPIRRVLGVSDSSSREEILDYARRYGLPTVLVRTKDQSDGWYGAIRVVDLAASGRSIRSLIRNLPRIPADVRKLEALMILRENNSAFGILTDDETVVGVVSERGLVEQLFRPSQAPRPSLP